MSTLQERLDGLPHKHVILCKGSDDPLNWHCHRPDLSVFASFDEDIGGATVTLMMTAMFGQGSRFAEMTPDEARQLARVLDAAADAVAAEAITHD